MIKGLFVCKQFKVINLSKTPIYFSEHLCVWLMRIYMETYSRNHAHLNNGKFNIKRTKGEDNLSTYYNNNTHV